MTISKMDRKKKFFLLPEWIALAGGLIYLAQAVFNLIYQLPNMDEGAYLFKGYHFALGTYQPFQAYGFWTNKMYLAFLIWGWIQRIFTPGLMAPRLFAILFGLLALLGTWIVTKRLGNRWLAALSVLVLALNPELVSTYSLANSQVLVFCILTWIMVLSLGADRKPWQIILGALLAGLMVFIRENMIFILPLLAAYIFWQHGRKKGICALSVMVLVLVIGHLLYWPGITYIWTRWLPNFSAIFTSSPSSTESAKAGFLSNISGILSLATVFRVLFVPFLCTLVVLLFWPARNSWQTKDQRRTAIFLLCTFFILLVTHAWASVGNDYCVFCTTNYFAFFINLALILFSACYSALNHSPRQWRKIIFILTIPLMASAILFSWFEKFGYSLIKLKLPQVENGKLIPGPITLWETLQDRFNLPLETSRVIFPAILGLFAGIILVLLGFLVFRIFAKRKKSGFVYKFALTLLLTGIIFTPLLSMPESESYCTINVTGLYQSIGAQISQHLEPGSKIYIDGRLSAIPLLYLRDIEYYPPQINDQFSFKLTPNTDYLLQHGQWNEELAGRWRAEADAFVIESDRIQDWKGYILEYGMINIPLEEDWNSCPSIAGLSFFTK